VKLRWLRSGSASLSHHVEFIESRDPAAAQEVRHRIRRAVLRLVQFPQCGRVGQVLGTRELRVSNLPYLVVYRVREREVQILRVWHERQDFH
jgi:toxin ParE1/3/4